MLTGIVMIKAKQNMRDELVNLIKQCAVKTKDEEGCLLYELFLSAENDCDAVLIEKWKDKDALDAHFDTEHYKELIEKSEGLKAASDTVEMFCTD